MTNSAVGDTTANAIRSRRSLLGAGVVGAAAAVLAGRAVSASTPVGEPSEEERALLAFAMNLELTARDLYDAAIAAGADPTLLEPMSEQHEAYAQAIAGLIGGSAQRRLDSVFDDAESSFATSDTDAVVLAAYDLESAAVATHTELLGLLDYVDAAKLVASILAVEARHCTVLAHAAGLGDDLDAMLVNDATPILPEDNS